MNDWKLNIPDLDAPQPVPPPPSAVPGPSLKTQKILHISDPHVQRDYMVRLNLLKICT